MKDQRRLGLGLEALLGGLPAPGAVDTAALKEGNTPPAETGPNGAEYAASSALDGSPGSGNGSPASRNGDGLIEASPDELRPNPYQPRKDFNEEELRQLAESIRRTGLLQPLVARRRDGMLEVVAGERRLRAARLAGLTRVPVLVRKVDDRGMLQTALVENLHRRDLNAIEKARAFQQLMKMNAWSQDEAADSVGLGRSTVANLLRLMELPLDVQEMVRSGALSMGHARALLGASTAELRRQILKRILEEELSVRAVETLVSSEAPSPRRTSIGPRDPHIVDLERRLSHFFGTRVELSMRGKGGKLTVRWYSGEQFTQIVRKLGI